MPAKSILFEVTLIGTPLYKWLIGTSLAENAELEFEA